MLEEKISHAGDYNSHNTKRLDVSSMKKMLMKLTFLQDIVSGEKVYSEE